MEQLPDEHRLSPGQSQARRGLCGRDPLVRGQVDQVPQSGALGLLRLLSGCVQGKDKDNSIVDFFSGRCQMRAGACFGDFRTLNAAITLFSLF